MCWAKTFEGIVTKQQDEPENGQNFKVCGLVQLGPSLVTSQDCQDWTRSWNHPFGVSTHIGTSFFFLFLGISSRFSLFSAFISLPAIPINVDVFTCYCGLTVYKPSMSSRCSVRRDVVRFRCQLIGCHQLLSFIFTCMRVHIEVSCGWWLGRGCVGENNPTFVKKKKKKVVQKFYLWIKRKHRAYNSWIFKSRQS